MQTPDRPRCADCQHFDGAQGHPQWQGSGKCKRWRADYGLAPATLKPNDCWVENDEGWANAVGPNFGCVLFERRAEEVHDPHP